jgi:hypothetical protein
MASMSPAVSRSGAGRANLGIGYVTPRMEPRPTASPETKYLHADVDVDSDPSDGEENDDQYARAIMEILDMIFRPA